MPLTQEDEEDKERLRGRKETSFNGIKEEKGGGEKEDEAVLPRVGCPASNRLFPVVLQQVCKRLLQILQLSNTVLHTLAQRLLGTHTHAHTIKHVYHTIQTHTGEKTLYISHLIRVIAWSCKAVEFLKNRVLLLM